MDKETSRAITAFIAEAYASGLPRLEIQQLIKNKFNEDITITSITKRAARLGIKHPNRNNPRGKIELDRSVKEAIMARKTKAELTEEARLEAKLRELDKRKKEGDRKYRALLDELTATRKALDDALLIVNRKPKIHKIKNPGDRKKGRATAFGCLSDVHCEEVVSPSKVNYLNKHNPEISKKRVARFFELLLRFIRVERQECEIDDLVLWLGGDFYTGQMHDAPVAMMAADAAMFAQDMVVSGIRFLCEQEPNLRIKVIGSVGNHSRLAGSLKNVNQANEQETSLEWVMYHAIKMVFADNPNIEFQLDNSYHSYLKVYDKTIRFNHGHLGWRYNQGLGGVHGPLWKVISQTWDNQIAADLTVCGHYHTFTPAALGRPYIVNGSVIGASPYGIQYGYEEPAQMFFLIHNKYGVVGQRPLFVNM